ncbi:uncharacterized protein LOC121921183 isoform X2 [Sceloporus undulatus]|uniref:uncharacterized protein LOC121921183 isoform X2 n=1 Tax=Sceloporus undulatus TaxID=8520 RepID=UPI001C4AB261|nr:uncharacterized protein LOC121921183 isoform X2 [Sceloporus undulatus]
MSAKEPLLGTLKVCILNLQGSSSPHKDNSPHLQPFCEILEMILRKGIKQPVLGFKRKDYWHWLEQLPNQETPHSMPHLSMMIEKTNSCQKLLTAQGRGRYFLRLALNGKLLAVALQQLVKSPRMSEWYDPLTSILGNEDFSEPFLSLMLVVTEMNFSLDMQNSSFLDESWQLPVCVTYDTVPCRELGMVLRYLDGRIFIIDVLPQSQAEVDEVVLVGDVIDEINGFSLRNACNGQAGTVLQKLKGKPLSFRLIRWKWHDGGMYKPLLPYLKILREKIPRFQLQHEHVQKEKKEDRSLQGGSFLILFSVWRQRSVRLWHTYGFREMFTTTVLGTLVSCCDDVLSHFLYEREVQVRAKAVHRMSSGSLKWWFYLMSKKPKFSFKGKRLQRVSPESPEHSTFDCLVFESNSEEESEEIIRRIAAGFKHTEWFV